MRNENQPDKQSNNQKDADVMTVERLRKHWFGPGRVPFWNYDPDQLTIGLEIESFIGRYVSGRLQMATKKQYMDVMTQLVKNCGYTDRSLKDQPGRVSKDTPSGFIAIKPDFAWHILEIALPPRSDVSQIRTLLEKTFAEVDAALKVVGLERIDLSCLPDVPEAMELVALDRLSGFKSANSLDPVRSHLDVFPALIAATHVHINCCDEFGFGSMKELYQRDLLAQKLFTRANQFKGFTENNFRSQFYEECFGKEYLLRTVPLEIPTSLVDYAESFNKSPKLFPNDRFFPVRDMSYIRPTPQGTMEFRSACSYLDINKIIEIVTFRRSQVIEILSAPDRKVDLRVAR